MKRSPAVVVVVGLTMASAIAQIPRSVSDDAHTGRVDSAIAALRNVKTPEAQELLCHLYGSIEDRDRAVQACEAAAAAAPNKSDYALNLARAYGDKADHGGVLTGMRMVGKIRGGFERAVHLDPKSVEALSDLGQFYVEAPGAVGGGAGKAEDLVTALQPLSPARAHRLEGMIAAKHHDDGKAEAAFQAEVAVSHSPEAFVDLAKYYRDRKQYEASESAARSAIAEDHRHGPDSLDAASLLLQMHRGVPAAQEALRNYLATPQQGVAAYAHAHVLLGDSLKASGDTAGAMAEYSAALALARDYDPARKAAGK